MGERREFHYDEINIAGICKDLRKNAWMIVLMAVSVWLAVTGLHKLNYEPEYTATATLAVNIKGTNTNAYSSLSMTNKLANIISRVFDSNVLWKRIEEDLGEDSLAGDISIEVINETNLVVLNVTSVNPRQTYQIINSALKNYDTVSDYLFSNAVLRVLKEPTVPFSPSNVTDIGRKRLLAVIAAALMMTAAICLISVSRFTVKTEQGAKRSLDGKIQGVIPYERKPMTLRESIKKKKKSLLVTSPMVSMDYKEAFRKIATRLEQHMKHRNQQIILVASVSENEGKSSVTANLALALAEKGRKVLLIDTDLKKPAQYMIFGRPKKEEGWLNDFLAGSSIIMDIIYHDEVTHLDSIYQNQGLRDSEVLLNSPKMKLMLNACRKMYDYVILDSPPMSVASDAEMLMSQVDTVALVVRQEWNDIRQINDTADIIRRSGVDFSGFVLNGFQKDLFFRKTNNYGEYEK